MAGGTGDRRHQRPRAARGRVRRPDPAAHHRPGRGDDGADGARATIAATEPGVLEISNLSSERTVALLTEHTIPFTEVAAHRSTLEQAYLELTRETAEFRAAEAAS